MDINIETQLKEKKNINSVNDDILSKIELSNNISTIKDDSFTEIANLSDIFQNERENSNTYRIYGRIEFLSLLNGLKNNYESFQDFFLPQKFNSKNILNSFDFYLIKPSSKEYRNIINLNNVWERNFEVIATPENINIFPIGFTYNIYGEQIYSFDFNVDINISNHYDYFNFPLTEIYLFAFYKKTGDESFVVTSWSDSGIPCLSILDYVSYNIGDIIYIPSTGKTMGDLVEYDKNNYQQKSHSKQTLKLYTRYFENGSSWFLRWQYEPFIPIKLRYFDNVLSKANKNLSKYDSVNSIPHYATKINDSETYVWREILKEGYIDPLTGEGNDIPLVNGKRYLFNTIVLDMIPDLTHDNTSNRFNEIYYTKNALIVDDTLLSNINKIGKLCN